mmetsp:Transcript_141029/g.351736  ORF Transcript_141029/g.351736 Transcript_141029/m.351736 type:complete len:200 (+) Transcript_141029:390-989(+)
MTRLRSCRPCALRRRADFSSATRESTCSRLVWKHLTQLRPRARRIWRSHSARPRTSREPQLSRARGELDRSKMRWTTSASAFGALRPQETRQPPRYCRLARPRLRPGRAPLPRQAPQRRWQRASPPSRADCRSWRRASRPQGGLRRLWKHLPGPPRLSLEGCISVSMPAAKIVRPSVTPLPIKPMSAIRTTNWSQRAAW